MVPSSFEVVLDAELVVDEVGDVFSVVLSVASNELEVVVVVIYSAVVD